MNIAIEDLGLERLDVVHAGQETYSLSERIRAVALSNVPRVLGVRDRRARTGRK
jgi:hypothetical protein